MSWRLIDEVFPGVLSLRNFKVRGWLKSLELPLKDRATKLVPKLVGLPKESLTHLETSLQDEHQRLNNIEQKARMALGATSVIIPLTLLIITRAPSSACMKTIAVIAIAFLVVGMLQAIRANSIGAIVYVGEEDFKDVAEENRAPDHSAHILLVASLLAARDQMADVNRFKVNATDAALRSLRNGVLALAIAVIATVVQN